MKSARRNVLEEHNGLTFEKFTKVFPITKEKLKSLITNDEGVDVDDDSDDDDDSNEENTFEEKNEDNVENVSITFSY